MGNCGQKGELNFISFLKKDKNLKQEHSLLTI